MFRIPGQDITVPDKLPSEEDVADGGASVIDFLLRWPALITAIIVAAILIKMWQNVGMRILMIAIGVVIVTVWFMNNS